MSGRYPGAATLEEYWENLRSGRDCIVEIPGERWSLEGFYEADLARRSADLLADLDPLAAVSLADEAMALAVRSGSPTFQLRAALARHRARPDRQALADLARLCADAEDDNLPEVAAARRIVDAGT